MHFIVDEVDAKISIMHKQNHKVKNFTMNDHPHKNDGGGTETRWVVVFAKDESGLKRICLVWDMTTKCALEKILQEEEDGWRRRSLCSQTQ